MLPLDPCQNARLPTGLNADGTREGLAAVVGMACRLRQFSGRPNAEQIMNTCRWLLALGLTTVLAMPALAGIRFGKHSKTPPAERVPQLLAQVKTDKSEDQRANAAKELREFDPAAFPEIIPILVDVLGHDEKASVRAEAAQSLGKLRPIAPDAGLALEAALKDSSFKVRLQARSSLLSYRLSGYHTPDKSTEAAAPPPIVKTTPLIQPRPVTTAPAPRPLIHHATGETPPPPLASDDTPAPLPRNPVPVAPTGLPKRPAAPKQAEDGPDL